MNSVFSGLLLSFVAVLCPMGIVTLAEDVSSASDSDPALDGGGEAAIPAELASLHGELALQQDRPSKADRGDFHVNLVQPGERYWTVDYRVRTFVGSHTNFQFGTGDPESGGYAPLSKLDWSLDSTWHGLQVALERPGWRMHFEWLTPMVQEIYGQMEDFDWSGADRQPASLQRSPEHWREGQTLELEGSFKLTDRCFSLPIEIWPTAGFRFQRFSMMAYDGFQVINDGTMKGVIIPPVGYRWNEDMISFNQQYYMSYIGGQLRTSLKLLNRRPVQLVFQGDWAGTWGYNVDHHIAGNEAQGIHSYCMDTTEGGALHLALCAETPLGKRFVFGFQADHTEIRTTGSHHDYETGARVTDSRSTHGVSVTSDQNTLTAYIRGCF